LKVSERNYKRIVIKIGSSLFCGQGGSLDFGLIDKLVGQVKTLLEQKKDVVLVTSGAIALGMSALGIARRPKELSYLQAAAAVGQNELMNVYRKAFKDKGLNCAQILLTWEDFADRKRYLNAKNTLLTLIKLRTVPIINENDSISTDEIKFGDNDKLSALVSGLLGADLLVILSDVDGLLDKDKNLIRVVEKIDSQIKNLARPSDKDTSVGGMITKIEAAEIATGAGTVSIVANGRKENIVLSVVTDDTSDGTLFVPKKGFIAARKRWIAFGTKPKGKITVDDGAKDALLNNKSLLAVGVIASDGNFESGDIVSVIDKDNVEIARGKAGLSFRQLGKFKGFRCDKEVIHRDNIVVL